MDTCLSAIYMIDKHLLLTVMHILRKFSAHVYLQLYHMTLNMSVAIAMCITYWNKSYEKAVTLRHRTILTHHYLLHEM